MIPSNIYPGQTLMTFKFGIAVIRGVYTHPETRQVCCDVKTKSGEQLHLSLKYVSRLMDTQSENPA